MSYVVGLQVKKGQFLDPDRPPTYIASDPLARLAPGSLTDTVPAVYSAPWLGNVLGTSHLQLASESLPGIDQTAPNCVPAYAQPPDKAQIAPPVSLQPMSQTQPNTTQAVPLTPAATLHPPLAATIEASPPAHPP